MTKSMAWFLLNLGLNHEFSLIYWGVSLSLRSLSLGNNCWATRKFTNKINRIYTLMMTMMMMMEKEGRGESRKGRGGEGVDFYYLLIECFVPQSLRSHMRSSSLNNWMEVSTFCLGVQVLPVTWLYRIYWWRRKVKQRLWGSCIHQLAGHPRFSH